MNQSALPTNQSNQYRNQMFSALEVLSSLASSGQSARLVDAFQVVLRCIESDRFKVIVLGDFSTGKSTLLKALLALPAPSGTDAPLPTGDVPTTSTITYISYAQTAYVRAWDHSGKYSNWTLERYFNEAMLHDAPQENERFSISVKVLELGWPADFLQEGVELLETPGLNNTAALDQLVMEAVNECDLVVNVQRAGGLLTLHAQQLMASLRQESVPVLLVANLFHDQSVNQRLRNFALERLAATSGSSGSNVKGRGALVGRDLFFIDCKAALRGRLGNDEAQVTASGLPMLEARLAEIIFGERRILKLARHLGRAIRLAAELKEFITLKLVAVKQEIAVANQQRNQITTYLERLENREHLLTGIGREQLRAFLYRQLPPKEGARIQTLLAATWADMTSESLAAAVLGDSTAKLIQSARVDLAPVENLLLQLHHEAGKLQDMLATVEAQAALLEAAHTNIPEAELLSHEEEVTVEEEEIQPLVWGVE